MTRLAPLRVRLARLKRRRRAVRLGVAASAIALAAIWALAAAFAVDWTFEMDKSQRAVSLVLVALVVVWALRRFTRPLWGRTETALDMALLVERQQHIDSDLVAALQFESPAAASWGSSQLECAVVDYVAEFGKGVNVLEGFSYRQIGRRSGALVFSLALVAVGAACFPDHAGAFLDRFLLGSRHYPTRTAIDSVTVNGRIVYPAESETADRSAYGRPLRFEVHWSGEAPDEGRVQLTTLSSRAESVIALTPQGKSADGGAVYAGQLPRLIDSVSYQVFLGDAWTDAASLRVIPLPIVDVILEATPPSYAAGQTIPDNAEGGSRQLWVIEGSQVRLQVRCANKALKAASLALGGKDYRLVRQDDQRRAWKLAATDTPLASVREPLTYEIRVTDADGLELEHALQGFIRIKADRPPRVTAAVVTQFVLPTAAPRIAYGATDDYGVARLRIPRQVIRQEDKSDEEGATAGAKPAAKTPEDVVDIPLKAGRPKVVQGRYKLDLAPLKLAKGDQLKLTLEAIDYRGQRQGVSATSEPITLQVTDERGVLAAMVESDERSARQLDAIIERQLGIGESP